MRSFSTISDGRLGIKPGEYVFLELYCTDKSCDCRRAMIQVQDPNGNLYATLSYGWEDRQFYVDWMYGDTVGIDDLPGINLYSLQAQSEYADRFLGIFREMMEDRTLAERYQRHYKQFKDALNGSKERTRSPIKLAEQRKSRRRLRRQAESALHR